MRALVELDRPNSGRPVLPLADPAAASVAVAGGKGAGLARLVAADLPVPAGVVVTAAACADLLERAGLGGARAELTSRTAAPAREDEAPWLAGVRARIAAAPVPPELAAALRAELGPLLDLPLAVRSSATVEDGAAASFAGQFESRLGVRGEPELHEALRACLASLFTARVAAYLRQQAGPPAEPGLAVVVQELVEADAAGALFTVNPLTGLEEETVVEAVHGPGEGHASGREATDWWVVDVDREVVSSAVRASSGPPPLADAEVFALAALGARAQEALGLPLDLEWAKAGPDLALVQARPITRIHFAPELGEWTTADFRDGGVSSAPCTALMASLYALAFECSMPRYLGSLGLIPRGQRSRWFRVFFARPYWNVAAAKDAVGRLPGFVERNFDHDLGIEPHYDGPGRTTPTNRATVLRALPVLLRLHLGYRRRLRENARFLSRFPALLAPFELEPAALAALPRAQFLEALRRLVEEVYLETETSYFETIYNTSNAKLDFSVPFARARERIPLDYGKLVGGLRDLSHLRPLADLHALAGRIRAEGRRATEEDAVAFARRWPWHGRRELDLAVPRWPDDLPFVRELVERAVAAFRPEADPAAAAERQHALHAAERDRALSALPPLARRGFRARLRRLRRFTFEREELRDRSSRVYAVLRRWALEAGRRLEDAARLERAEDVFFLDRWELLAAAEGRLPAVEVRWRAGRGRRRFRSFRHFANPNELGARHEVGPERPPPSGPVLRGTPCSPGVATGPARVVRSLEEAGRLAPGDVLVAPFTDPGWTPLFPGLAAVVTEAGGLLSHAAVIAREYGIPAVLAVPGATRLVRDGEPLTVDGGAGTVARDEAGP